MLNSITIMGRLTRDPELRYTQSQIPVASFTLAVDRDYKSDGGDRETDFIDCVAWRGTGEFVSKWFTKGQMAVVSGRLQIRPWEDRDGNKRRSAEIVANNVYFGESKRNREESGGQSYHTEDGRNRAGGGYATSPEYGGYAEPGGFSDLSDSDGELPF